MSRIGVLGLGGIGRAVAEYALAHPAHSISFARNRSDTHTEWAAAIGVAAGVGLPTDDELAGTDLVVEAAHPDVVAHEGARILQHCDLLVVSAGALADPTLLADLTDCATRAGTNLIVPQGALVGLDGVLAQTWTRAAITMVKSPHHLEPAPSDITDATVLYEGPVGPLAGRYPRNVNAMVAFALATLGVEGTAATLIADPDTTVGRLEMTLSADDGTTLSIAKSQPMVGVSGSEMTHSILHTVDAVTGTIEPGLRFG